MSARGNPPQPGTVHVHADGEAVALAAAELFVSVCAEAIAIRGRSRVALSGGSTPKRTYELLALPQRAARVDWANVDIFWGDERYVPPDDPRSNYRMTREALLAHVPIPQANVHPVQTDIAPARAAAAACEDSIRQCFSMSSGIPRFDLIFLGLGTNGHTASLFPNSPVLSETKLLVAADFVGEVNMWRITTTVPVLNAGRTVAFLVAGKDKAEVTREVRSGRRDPDRLPAQLIQPTEGNLLWIVDRAAAEFAA